MFDIAHVDLTPTQEALDVHTAATWLDYLKPGWANLINLDTLNLESYRCCVLGQVFALEAAVTSFSGYHYGWQQLCSRVAGGRSFPFNVNVFANDRTYKSYWINAIRHRTALQRVAAVA